MRTIQIDRDLLLALVTFAESRSMQARLEAVKADSEFTTTPTQENHRRWADADDVARRSLAAVQRGNALLYPKPQEVPGVVVERNILPSSEPPVEGTTTLLKRMGL